MHKKLIILVMSATLALSANADNQVAATENDTMKPPVQESLKLVGEGMMTYIFWDVYYARLYTKNGAYESKVSDTAIEFNYELDIKSKDLVEETIKQWRELEFDIHPEEEQWANALLEIWPDVAEGDQLLFHINSEGLSDFYFNNQFRGTIASQEFSYRFKSIWLSEDTSASKLRRKLLNIKKKR